ncbi:MAG TPA: hypothetical protein VM364_04670 [Vicinamibacterales bacterium]|nr:hypothetical protein [Vicinamibacterales bacterium]
MMIEIKTTRTFSFDKIELVTREDMREIGLLARERIVRRTRQAQGPNGPFRPLSARYAEQKHKALGGAAQPDLTVSGNMLNDLDVVDVSVTDQEAHVRLGWKK